VTAAKRALDEGAHHYSDVLGLLTLRKEIVRKLAQDNSLSYEPDEIMVCNGAQEAIFLTFLALLESGDEGYCCQRPVSPVTTGLVRAAGGVVVDIPSGERDGFVPNLEKISTLITPRTKVMAVVTPGNPTGTVISPAHLGKLAQLAIDHDLTVLSDEVNELLIYPGFEHVSIASLPKMRERTVVVNGFSKAYAMSGWRIGYLAAPSDFVSALILLKHTASLATATVMQEGAVAALASARNSYKTMLIEYQLRRDLLTTMLDGCGLTYATPGGATYVYANIDGTGLDDEAFSLALVRETGVLVYPGNILRGRGPSPRSFFVARDICGVRSWRVSCRGFSAQTVGCVLVQTWRCSVRPSFSRFASSALEKGKGHDNCAGIDAYVA